MRVNIINFSIHEEPEMLRWLCGRQFPMWIQQMLLLKAQGEDCGKLIDELADVCCVTLETELLKI